MALQRGLSQVGRAGGCWRVECEPGLLSGRGGGRGAGGREDVELARDEGERVHASVGGSGDDGGPAVMAVGDSVCRPSVFEDAARSMDVQVKLLPCHCLPGTASHVPAQPGRSGARCASSAAAYHATHQSPLTQSKAPRARVFHFISQACPLNMFPPLSACS